MAVMYITEYSDFALSNGAVIPQEPPTAEQTVAIGVEAKSAAFQNNTRIVRLHCDAICSVEFGTAPTATTSKARMAANETRTVLVNPGSAFKVSVISNT